MILQKAIDINCDMGESYGRFQVGNDRELLPYVTSCNIACGFHGGDPLTMEQAIALAIHHNVKIGAHPSYPDLMGFGRRKMDISYPILKAYIKYQVGALCKMVEAANYNLTHVKPHGALYNTAAQDQQTAMAIIDGVKEIDPNLYIMGLAGSNFEKLAREQNVKFIAEAFADRRYTDKGTLQNREHENAVIYEPGEAALQVLNIVTTSTVKTISESSIDIKAQSLCIHGDNPNAVDILKSISLILDANDIKKESFVEL